MGRPPTYANELECFEAKVDKSGDCWQWLGGVSVYGRGLFTYKSHCVQAHRAAWRLYNGTIPDGLFVLHHCDNPLCVNPGQKHLFLGTQAVNLDDMKAKGRDKRTGRKWLSPEVRAQIINDAGGGGIQKVVIASAKYGITVKSVLRILGRWHEKKEAIIG